MKPGCGTVHNRCLFLMIFLYDDLIADLSRKPYPWNWYTVIAWIIFLLAGSGSSKPYYIHAQLFARISIYDVYVGDISLWKRVIYWKFEKCHGAIWFVLMYNLISWDITE